jgi:hypothetical protein
MSPLVVRHLAEIRQTMAAAIHVVEDDGNAIVVLVVPFDLPPFFLTMDPQYFADEACH